MARSGEEVGLEGDDYAPGVVLVVPVVLVVVVVGALAGGTVTGGVVVG
jgi:hypothetical protein